MKKFMAGLAVLSIGSAQAVTVLSEGFDNVSGLSAAGWVLANNSVATVGPTFFQGNTAIFSAQAGAADSYAAANFTSTAAITGAVSNWLITPVLMLDSTSVLSFFVRVAGEDFLDKLEVRLSAGGSSVGATATSVGDFGTLLDTFSAQTAGGWVGLSYSALGLTSPTTARLAFRYVIDDVATAGNYLGIDSVNVTAVPEPSTYVLMGLGVAGLLLRRRTAA